MQTTRLCTLALLSRATRTLPSISCGPAHSSPTSPTASAVASHCAYTTTQLLSAALAGKQHCLMAFCAAKEHQLPAST